MVVAITVAGPTDPAVLHSRRIQTPERINHFELLSRLEEGLKDLMWLDRWLSKEGCVVRTGSPEGA